MQAQTFADQGFRGHEEHCYVPEPHRKPMRPVKMLREEKARQMERVKQVFPDESGIVGDKFFSSKISPQGRYGESIDDIINLALLTEKLFSNGSYKVVEIDPRVECGHPIPVINVRKDRFVESNGPEIYIYVERGNALTGILKAEMSTENNNFYGKTAEIIKLPPEFFYKIGPTTLKKINMSTGKVEHSLEVSYYDSFKRLSEVKKPLTTQQALGYLTKELGLPV